MSGQSAVAQDRNAGQRYTNVAIVLHWLIALGVFALVGVAWYMVDIPKGAPERAFWFNLHKSTGTTVGVLVLGSVVATILFLRRVVYHLEYAKLGREHLSFNPLGTARSPG